MTGPKPLKPLGSYDIRSRGYPYFGHGFGQYARALCKALGMSSEVARTAKVFTGFDTPGVWFMWTGSNGQRYKHKFESDPAQMGEEEFAALKVKVRLSTC